MANQSPPHQNNQSPTPRLDQALLALANLNFYLNVQQTALNEANVLAAEIRHLLHTDKPDDDRTVCAIDKEAINPDEALALPCGHVFHSKCIGQWLEHSNTCPECRTPAYPENAESGADSAATDDDGSSSASTDDSTPSTPSTAASVPEFDTSTVDPTLIEQLAFHHRLIAEIELLAARAGELVAEGTETELNMRWTAFLHEQITSLYEGAERLEDEILRPEEEGEE